VSQSFDLVMRLVAHVPIKFIEADWRFRDEAVRLYKLAADQGKCRRAELIGSYEWNLARAKMMFVPMLSQRLAKPSRPNTVP
jgi:hypothetical protein